MKRFVNGEEVDLAGDAAEVAVLPDRLMVRTPDGTHSALAVKQGDTVTVSFRGSVYVIEKATRSKSARGSAEGEIRAPMPGAIVDVLVTQGQQVQKGDRLLVLEAMKTQQPFNAPFDGVVMSVSAAKGQQVSDGEVLVVVEPAE